MTNVVKEPVWHSFMPFLFIAWDFYNTGSLIESFVISCRDFAWPAAVVVAKSFNASPY